jgi:hypothetical protein
MVAIDKTPVDDVIYASFVIDSERVRQRVRAKIRAVSPRDPVSAKLAFGCLGVLSVIIATAWLKFGSRARDSISGPLVLLVAGFAILVFVCFGSQIRDFLLDRLARKARDLGSLIEWRFTNEGLSCDKPTEGHRRPWDWVEGVFQCAHGILITYRNPAWIDGYLEREWLPLDAFDSADGAQRFAALAKQCAKRYTVVDDPRRKYAKVSIKDVVDEI